MTFKLVCTANAVISMAFGIAFVVAAEPAMAMYAPEGALALTPLGLAITNLFGAALIGFGVVAFQAREAEDSVARRAIAMGFVVGNTIAAVVGVLIVTAGAVNALGWSTVALYAIFAVGFAMTGLSKSSA